MDIKPVSSPSAVEELSSIKQALDVAAIVAITDEKGNIIHANDKFCEISKYSREELLGKNHRIINSGFHPKEFFIEMWKTISSGQVWENEICNRAKDGSIYWVNTCIIPFLNENKKPYQYVSISYEITARKEAERKLKVYADKLEKSNRELENFASIAAHDLQEPLRKVLAFSDRLISRFSEQLPEDAKNYLERIGASSKRMQTLIDDLLTYSRVSTKGDFFAKVDLNKVLSDVLSDLEIRIERTSAKIETKNLPIIDADEVQMRQLFQNLIGNALKFHKKDLLPLILVSAADNIKNVVISIKDNGIGFEEKYLDRIFSIFQRLHGKSEYEGNGVGLAVCRRIIDRHQGSITAKSAPGQGAEFLVTLPKKHKSEV